MIYMGVKAYDTNKEMHSHGMRKLIASTGRDVLMEKFAYRGLKIQTEETSGAPCEMDGVEREERDRSMLGWI